MAIGSCGGREGVEGEGVQGNRVWKWAAEGEGWGVRRHRGTK